MPQEGRTKLGETIRREMSLGEGVDTGRVQTLPLPNRPAYIDPETGQPGPMVSMGTVNVPIHRASFLQSFLASLGPALAYGLAPQPGAPFGTGLPGALQGIQAHEQQNIENARQAWQMRMQAQQEQRLAGQAASTQAYQ